MHDPMTLAFSIRNPFVSQAPLLRGEKPYHPPLIDIWHVDPEKDGSDDSCDWFGRHRHLNAKEQALADALGEVSHILGNEPFWPHPRLYGHEPYFDETNHSPKRELDRAFYAWRRKGPVRWHPRWHVHHWRITVVPLLHFKRWMWSRCEACGGSFRWGEAPVSNGWGGRLRWFKGDDGVRHMRCDGASVHLTEERSGADQTLAERSRAADAGDRAPISPTQDGENDR